MANKTVKFISKKMKAIDICMMSTIGTNGAVHTRPMSNNRDVAYNGESYFFSHINTRKAKDLENNSKVTLSFTGDAGLYIIVEGKGRIIKDRTRMEEHWVPDLEQWFEDGLETEGLILIAVKASAIKYWDNYKEGEIDLKEKRSKVG